MSIEQMISEASEGGQATATPEESNANDLDTRFEGITDPDEAEPEAPENGEEGTETPEGEGEPEEQPEEAADPWEGYEEFELDGKVLKIPSEAKDYLLRQADYTRKTQAVSEKERQLAAKEQEVAQRFALSEQELSARVAMANTMEALREFENVNWDAERAQATGDPMAELEFHNKYHRYQRLAQQYQNASGFIQQAQQQRSAQAEQEIATRLQETARYAQEKIKGWTPELDAKMTNWATTELGFTTDMLKQAYNPSVYRALMGAYQWEQSLQRQQTAKPSRPAAPPPEKTTTVTGKSNPKASKELWEMSEDEFFAHREAEIARKRK